MEDTIRGVHQLFFNSKNVLTREQRMNFIEIVYSFLELKVLDLLKPDLFSFLCKDGIDVGSVASAQFYAFLKLISNEQISDRDQQHIDTILYAPAMLLRERIVLPERFHRMINVLKIIENTRSEMGEGRFKEAIQETFGELYDSDVLGTKVMPIQHQAV